MPCRDPLVTATSSEVFGFHPVRPREGQSIGAALVFIRLVPGIDTDDARKVARVEMIDQRGFALGFEIRAVLAAIRFEGGDDGLLSSNHFLPLSCILRRSLRFWRWLR